MNQQFKVGVIDRMSKGIASQEDLRERGWCVSASLEDALTTEYDFDAHLLCYELSSPDGPGYQRLIQGSELHSLLENTDGYAVQTRLICLDYDLPSHRGWDSPEEATEWVRGLKDALGPEGTPYCIYTTKHGARLIYRLSSPVPVLEIGPKIAGIIRDFNANGVELDPSCDQWSRLFRLPRVNRDGQKTSEAATFVCEITDTWLDPAVLEEAEPSSKSRVPVAGVQSVAVSYSTMPDPGELADLSESTPCKKARKVLKNAHRSMYEVLCEFGNLPQEGGRDNWLTRTLGALVRALRGNVKEFEQEHLLALCEEMLDRMEPDEGTPSWHAKAWELIQKFWVQDGAGEEAEKAEVKDKMEQLVENMIALHPRVHQIQDDHEEAMLWIREHAVLQHAGRFHILGWDGRWSQFGFDQKAVVSYVRDNRLEDLIEVTKFTESGPKPRPIADIMADHGTEVGSIVESCFCDDQEYMPATPGKPANVRMRAQRLADLQPRRDSAVDEWLRNATGDQYKSLVRWIVGSLEVKYPIAALSIRGAAGTGKNLLVSGLAECFEDPSYSGPSALDPGAWNGQLRGNPIIHVDEGESGIKAKTKKSISQDLRAMIGGGKVTLNEKFKANTQLEINPRVIFTANNLDIVRAMVGEGQSAQDLAAIQQRLLHLEFSHRAADFLTAQGGRRFTEDWVGSYSSHRLARHLLHLHKIHRDEVLEAASRFVCPGDVPLDLLTEMNFEGAESQSALDTILEFLEIIDLQPNLARGRAFCERTGQIYVSPDALNKYRLSRFSNERSCSKKTLSQVLEFIAPERLRGRTNLSNLGFEGKTYGAWQVIDASALYSAYGSAGGEIPDHLLRLMRTAFGKDAPSVMAELELQDPQELELKEILNG